MDLVWTERNDYEMLLFKRPACTHAQPSSATTATTKVSNAKKSTAKVSSVSADGKNFLAELEAARGFIRASLEKTPSATTLETLQEKSTRLETSNVSLRKLVDELTKQIEELEIKAKISHTKHKSSAV